MLVNTVADAIPTSSFGFRLIRRKYAEATGLELDGTRLSLASDHADRLAIGGDLDAAGVPQPDTNFPGAFDRFRFGRLHDFVESQLIVHVDADPARLGGSEIDSRDPGEWELAFGRPGLERHRSLLNHRVFLAE